MAIWPFGKKKKQETAEAEATAAEHQDAQEVQEVEATPGEERDWHRYSASEAEANASEAEARASEAEADAFEAESRTANANANASEAESRTANANADEAEARFAATGAGADEEEKGTDWHRYSASEAEAGASEAEARASEAEAGAFEAESRTASANAAASEAESRSANANADAFEAESRTAEANANEAEARNRVAPLENYDPVDGSTGPFDGDNVEIEDFDFSDFSQVTLNLGSIRIPMPQESQVQVEMGEQGPKMVHIVTRHGRITPVAFAAPRSGGLWAESTEEIVEGMRSEGMPVELEQGPWGTEIVGTGTNGVIRIIGVEGPRWLYRVTLAAPSGMEDQLAELGRETIARSFVYRGNDPILAGNSLPVTLPAQLAQQVQQAVEARAQQAQGSQQPQEGNPNALSDALQQIIAQNAEHQKQIDELRRSRQQGNGSGNADA